MIARNAGGAEHRLRGRERDIASTPERPRGYGSAHIETELL